MSRWILIVAFFAVTSAWSQQAPDVDASAAGTAARSATAVTPSAPAVTDGSCSKSEPDQVDQSDSVEDIQTKNTWLRYQSDLIHRLAGSNDPRTLLAASIFAGPLEMVAEADTANALKPKALLSRAQKAGPNEPQVWWISAVQNGGTDVRHAREQAIQRLLEIVPQNAAVWLLELDRANTADDPIAGRLAIEHAARATYFDDYLMAIASTLLRASENAPALPESLRTNEVGLSQDSAQKNQRMVMSIGFSLASAMPGYTALTHACYPKRAAVNDTQLRWDCAAVAKTMADNSTSLISQLIGLDLQRKLASNATEIAGIDSELRRWEWLRSNASRLDDSVDSAIVDRRYQLVLDGQSEQHNIQLLLREQGIPLEPPAEWKSSRHSESSSPTSSQ